MENLGKVDIVVVGAGVIGLAVARFLALAHHSVIVVERHRVPGSETSSRNSGVIHSGIYYPPASTKARLCVRGRELLYQYSEARNIPHRRCGKLIVAQATEIDRLEALLDNARRNGVTDLQCMDGTELRKREPAIRAAAGLWCPSTGIVSVHELMVSLLGELEESGGVVAFRTELIEARRGRDGFRLELSCDDERLSLDCSALVNATGLAAVGLLSRIEGYPGGRIPSPFFAKGNYFEFSGRSPFQHLVYPMPGEAGLGIHATLDIAGRLRFGPDVEWITAAAGEFDYSVTESRSEMFYAAIREYWPGLPEGSLQPSYSGMRPKLAGAGSSAADFRIEGPADHGVPGLVNLLGIESPGLTASLAIGELVSGLLQGAA